MQQRLEVAQLILEPYQLLGRLALGIEKRYYSWKRNFLVVTIESEDASVLVDSEVAVLSTR
jgi:hypothetical protein